MNRFMILAILLLGLGTASSAQTEDPLSAEEFDSLVTGKTLYYETLGGTYGVEEYLSNRRVRWSFLDGQCSEGVWYESDGHICFMYEDVPAEQCWTFWLDESGGLVARFKGSESNTELYEAAEGDPMQCLGPEVGV